MSILIGENTKVVVQGITGKEGAFHTRQMLAYGTNIVAGVTPGKGGEKVEGIPVLNRIKDAVDIFSANTSCIFVPPPFAPDAMLEAAGAGINVIVCITEGIPTLDMIKTVHFIRKCGAVLIGPNTPGIISPGKTKVGIITFISSLSILSGNQSMYAKSPRRQSYSLSRKLNIDELVL